MFHQTTILHTFLIRLAYSKQWKKKFIQFLSVYACRFIIYAWWIEIYEKRISNAAYSVFSSLLSHSLCSFFTVASSLLHSLSSSNFPLVALFFFFALLLQFLPLYHHHHHYYHLLRFHLSRSILNLFSLNFFTIIYYCMGCKIKSAKHEGKRPTSNENLKETYRERKKWMEYGKTLWEKWTKEIMISDILLTMYTVVNFFFFEMTKIRRKRQIKLTTHIFTISHFHSVTWTCQAQ